MQTDSELQLPAQNLDAAISAAVKAFSDLTQETLLQAPYPETLIDQQKVAKSNVKEAMGAYFVAIGIEQYDVAMLFTVDTRDGIAFLRWVKAHIQEINKANVNNDIPLDAVLISQIMSVWVILCELERIVNLKSNPQKQLYDKPGGFMTLSAKERLERENARILAKITLAETARITDSKYDDVIKKLATRASDLKKSLMPESARSSRSSKSPRSTSSPKS